MNTQKIFGYGARNLLCAIAVILAFAFIACDDGSGDDKTKTDAKTFTVTFDSDGGSDVDAQTVTENGKATKPADPTKAWTGTLPAGLHTGMPDSDHFDGWQKDGAAYDFNAPVTADITLTAKWTAPNPTPIDLTTRSEANIIAKSVAYINADDSETTEYTLVLDADVENVAAITHNKNGVTLEIISVDDTEVVISKGTASGRVFTVGGTNTTASSAKLVIDGNVILQGKASNNGSVVYVGYGGSLELKGNAKITGNSTSDQGGGIQTAGNATYRVTITMSGNAEISDNTITTTAAFTRYGGGIYLMYADLTMSDNAVIKNNTVDNTGPDQTSYGGGVYMNSGSSFTMEGGTISGNTVKAYGTGVAQGGGVCISSFASAYPFTMNGGEISGNAVISENGNAQGGGVSIAGVADCKFVVASEAVKANIKDNTVTRTGTTGSTTGPQVYRGNTNGFTVGGEAANSF